MKKSLLFLVLLIIVAAGYGVIPYVFAQTSNQGGSAVIPPPSAGNESITIPSVENLEVVPMTGETVSPETPVEMQPLQPSTNIPPLSGTTPTITEQPVAPISEGAVPGIPLSTPTEGLETSPTLQPLQPLEQPQSVEVAPAGIPPASGLTQTQPSTLQPSAEVPALPLSTETTQVPTTTTVPAVAPLPAAPEAPLPSTPLSTAPPPTVPQPQVQPAPAPSVQPQQATVQPSPAPTMPTKLVTKPPHVIPGEVLTSMPVYVNTETTHVVKPGDDLHWLAAIYYGDARLWYKIYDANKNVIKDPNRLVVGTKLIIPPK
jgi:nucleoid-associated protein YgaU